MRTNGCDIDWSTRHPSLVVFSRCVCVSLSSFVVALSCSSAHPDQWISGDWWKETFALWSFLPFLSCLFKSRMGETKSFQNSLSLWRNFFFCSFLESLFLFQQSWLAKCAYTFTGAPIFKWLYNFWMQSLWIFWFLFLHFVSLWNTQVSAGERRPLFCAHMWWCEYAVYTTHLHKTGMWKRRQLPIPGNTRIPAWIELVSQPARIVV
jgi:hypothetical protein